MRVDISELSPSQLYISKVKLRRVQELIDSGEDLPPVPVKQMDGHMMMTDGHTRAVAQYLRGESTIEIEWEDEDLDWDEYEVCLRWCNEEGVLGVAELAERIIPHDEYEVLWLGRCQRMRKDMNKEP